MDNEQLQLLVFDSICYDSKIKKMIEGKRKYIYVPPEMDENFEIINEKQLPLGSVLMRDRPEKPGKEYQEELKSRINIFRDELGIKGKNGNTKYPELQGVFKRLWKDVGIKEEKLQ